MEYRCNLKAVMLCQFTRGAMLMYQLSVETQCTAHRYAIWFLERAERWYLCWNWHINSWPTFSCFSISLLWTDIRCFFFIMEIFSCHNYRFLVIGQILWMVFSLSWILGSYSMIHLFYNLQLSLIFSIGLLSSSLSQISVYLLE